MLQERYEYFIIYVSTLLYDVITLYFAQHCLKLHSIFVIIIFVLNLLCEFFFCIYL